MNIRTHTSLARTSRRKMVAGAVSLTLATSVVGAVLATPVQAAATITVTTGSWGLHADDKCTLQEAILAANHDSSSVPLPDGSGDVLATGCAAGSGADVISLGPYAVLSMTGHVRDAANYTGRTGTPMITSDIVIEGNGATIRQEFAGARIRAFAVGETGRLELREVHIKDFGVRGGHGANGGGGGLGAGGAIFVHGGSLVVQDSTFEFNGATGGDGGNIGDSRAGGGGGGLGGSGGDVLHEIPNGGGGGGGANGHGSDGSYLGGGGGGTLTGGIQSAGGEQCGGDGGEEMVIGPSTDAEGDDGSCPGGGGGGGAARDAGPSLIIDCGDGGDGAFGGGGGGGGFLECAGGNGGFGGGGGAGVTADENLSGFGPDGGDGGFGGGGGAAHGGYLDGSPGSGGTFAGHATKEGGGGGAGLGGAIFGYGAQILVQNSTFTRNYAVRGESVGGNAQKGTDAGGAIFTVAGSLAVVNTTIAGNESTGDGAAITVYRPTTGEATGFRLTNSIVAKNTGRNACFLRNSSGGNVAATGSHNLIDATPDDPLTRCPGATTGADPQLGLLQLNAPGRTPTMALATTSPAIDAGTGVNAPSEDQRGVPRPQGAGHDIGAYEYASGIVGPTDTTAPTATPTAVPAANSFGWNNSDVTVSWNWTDGDGSGIDPAQCTSSSAVATEGTAVVLQATCRDLAGNLGSATYTVNLDKTAPTVTCGAAPVFTIGGNHDADVTATVSDDRSGPVSSPVTADVTAADIAAPGVKTKVLTGEDRAGNTASATCTFTVAYRFLGFLEPIPQSAYKRGSTIPVKFMLGNANGTPISDAAALALLSPTCRVHVTLDGQVKGCVRYDAAINVFQFDLKTSKSLATGSHTVGIRVAAPDGTGVINTDSTTVLIKK